LPDALVTIEVHEIQPRVVAAITVERMVTVHVAIAVVIAVISNDIAHTRVVPGLQVVILVVIAVEVGLVLGPGLVRLLRLHPPLVLDLVLARDLAIVRDRILHISTNTSTNTDTSTNTKMTKTKIRITKRAARTIQLIKTNQTNPTIRMIESLLKTIKATTSPRLKAGMEMAIKQCRVATKMIPARAVVHHDQTSQVDRIETKIEIDIDTATAETKIKTNMLNLLMITKTKSDPILLLKEDLQVEVAVGK